MSTPFSPPKPLLLRITQWLILLSLLVPLVVAPDSLIFPFVTPKAWFFQTCVMLAFAAWLILIRTDSTYRPRKNALTIAVFVFIAVMALSTITGVDFQRSMWANHERMLGLFTVTHFALFFLITASVFRTRHDVRLFLRVMLGVGLVVVGSAIVQHWYPNFLYGGARAASTLGNPLYLGLYAVYVAFIAGYVWYDEIAVSVARKDLLKKWETWATLVLVLLSIGAFFLAETRGVFVGVGVATLWILGWMASASTTRRVRMSALAVLIVFALGLSFFITAGDHAIFQNIPGLRRFSDRSLFSGTNANRLFAWQVAIDAWRERPVLGWGPFNYVYAFNDRYQGTQLVHNEFGETWFDNAHNFFLDTLATQGVLGFLAYLGLFVVPLSLLIRGWRRGKISLPVMLLVSGLLIMHLVQNIFAFEQITSYVTFFAVLALVYYLLYHRDEIGVVEGRRAERPSMIYVVVVCFFVSIIIYQGDFLPWRANHMMFSALSGLDTGQDAASWFSLHKQAIEIDSPYGDHIREELARVLLRVQVAPNQPRKEIREIFNYTIDELEKATIRHPREPVYHMLLGELWYGARVIMPNEFTQGESLGDRAFAEAIRLSPERQQLYLLWAQHRMQAGKIAEGLEIMKKARSYAPHSAFMLKLYADYLDSANVNRVEAAKIKDLIYRLAPSIYSIHQIEAIALEIAKWVSAARAEVILQSLLACKGEDTGAACPALYENVTYNPSRDVFTFLTDYYQTIKDQTALEKYTQIARRYFSDFVISPGAKITAVKKK